MEEWKLNSKKTATHTRFHRRVFFSHKTMIFTRQKKLTTTTTAKKGKKYVFSLRKTLYRLSYQVSDSGQTISFDTHFPYETVLQQSDSLTRL